MEAWFYIPKIKYYSICDKATRIEDIELFLVKANGQQHMHSRILKGHEFNCFRVTSPNTNDKNWNNEIFTWPYHFHNNSTLNIFLKLHLNCTLTALNCTLPMRKSYRVVEVVDENENFERCQNTHSSPSEVETRLQGCGKWSVDVITKARKTKVEIKRKKCGPLLWGAKLN